MTRLTSYDYGNKEVLVNEEEWLISSKGFIDKDEMYKVMKHLAEKLYEYENLEEQNLLVKLPCKVGDTVYVIDNGWLECEVKEFFFDGEAWKVALVDKHIGSELFIDVKAFNEYVFLSKEDAVKMLKILKEV